MVPFRLVPRIALHSSFAEFIKEFQLNGEDLIVTNEFIQTGVKPADLAARVVFQERFGTGEPSNVMMDSIFQEARRQPYKRVIAVGGGRSLMWLSCWLWAATAARWIILKGASRWKKPGN